MNIKIGDLVLALNFETEELEEKAREVFSFFETEQSAQLMVDIKYEIKQTESKFSVLCTGNKVIVTTEHFLSNLDFELKKGSINFIGSFDEVLLRNAVKNILVFCVMHNGGIVLHASGIVKDNKAYVFTGKSGSGKSTIVENSTDKRVLSEEVIALMPEDRAYKAFALPYNGDERFSNRTNESYILNGLYTLAHAKDNVCIKINKAQALAKMLILPAGIEKESQPLFLERFAKLVESIDCFELRFKPDPSFWSVLV